MRRTHRFPFASVVVFATFVAHGALATVMAQERPAPSAAATAAAKESPELVNALATELNSTPEQAAGAAGTLFGVAKTRLKPEDFSKVASAVPGMPSLLKAAPATGSSGSKALSQLGASAGGLAAAASAFSKLGLSPQLVSKAIPVLTSFVSKSGGADVGQLLAGALKH